jgi:hypothetical protein
MGTSDLFSGASPQARLAISVAPFIIAVFLRIVLGNCRLTRVLFSLGTVWFFVNVLMAPYSFGVRQNLDNWRALLR